MTDTIFGWSPKDLVNSRVAVIDGDSFAYIIGYNHKDGDDIDAVLEHVDDFIHTILQAVQCRFHVGILNPKNSKGEPEVRNFRADVAIKKEYKGQRPEKPEWYLKWAPVIEDRLIKTWKFKRAPHNMEADDLVASLMTSLNKIESCTPICCGCDKDLKQIPGHHYDYKKNVGAPIIEEEANLNLFRQVLIGDTSDNIPGLYKCGKVGAEKILTSEDVDTENYHLVTMHAFTCKLGIDEGIQSFYENYMLCKLRHDLDVSKAVLTAYDLDANSIREFKPREEEVEEVSFDPDLGDDILFTVD